MSGQAWLKPEEVPVEHRDSFHFDNQFLGPVGKRTGLYIERDCLNCSNTYNVLVTNIRGDLRRGRKMRAGKCKDCRGRVVTTEGYVWIHKPSHPNAYSGRYVPEHILVMEENLGRYLDTVVESVHHINGDPADNRLENLQLRSRYHGKGQARICNDCGSHNIVATKLN